jgi:hypothetical protein
MGGGTSEDTIAQVPLDGRVCRYIIDLHEHRQRAHPLKGLSDELAGGRRAHYHARRACVYRLGPASAIFRDDKTARPEDSLARHLLGMAREIKSAAREGGPLVMGPVGAQETALMMDSSRAGAETGSRGA